MCNDMELFVKRYINKRRNNEIHYQTTVCYDILSNEIFIIILKISNKDSG